MGKQVETKKKQKKKKWREKKEIISAQSARGLSSVRSDLRTTMVLAFEYRVFR